MTDQKFYVLIIFILGLLPQFLFSQVEATGSDDDMLAYYADVMINASKGKHRQKAGEAFYPRMKEALQREGSFKKAYKEVEWVSFQYPSDSTFRVISWQVRGENSYDYKGFIQTSGGETFELQSRKMLDANIEYEQMSDEDWIGQLVYDIYTIEKDAEKEYILFGMAQKDDYSKLKIAESLAFTSDGPVFGSPIFNDGTNQLRRKNKKRIVLDYSVGANVTLTYNPGLDMIVFDHIISAQGGPSNQGVSRLPDGSYEAYKNDGDQWVYVEKLYDHIYEEAPRPKPVNKSSKDIFGKQKKN